MEWLKRLFRRKPKTLRAIIEESIRSKAQDISAQINASNSLMDAAIDSGLIKQFTGTQEEWDALTDDDHCECCGQPLPSPPE